MLFLVRSVQPHYRVNSVITWEHNGYQFFAVWPLRTSCHLHLGPINTTDCRASCMLQWRLQADGRQYSTELIWRGIVHNHW